MLDVDPTRLPCCSSTININARVGNPAGDGHEQDTRPTILSYWNLEDDQNLKATTTEGGKGAKFPAPSCPGSR